MNEQRNCNGLPMKPSSINCFARNVPGKKRSCNVIWWMPLYDGKARSISSASVNVTVNGLSQ